MPASRPSAWARLRDSDIGASFLASPTAILSAGLLALLFATALLAPWITPQNPYDLTQLFLDKSELPPIWLADGEWPYLLGTDTQGRDVLSAILYGSRVSLLIGVAAVAVSLAIGVAVGLAAGFRGGWIDAVLMRIGDMVLSIPTLLVAILFAAIFRQLVPEGLRLLATPVILVSAIALTGWVTYARTVRGSTLVEARKEYVQAARILKVPPRRIMWRHILPNTLTPVMVAATLSFGLAILSEATLSFLGVGMPVEQPSLGTLIRIGNQFLFSGIWWVVAFPAVQLGLIVLAVNLLGDWLRDALNPRLR